MKLTKAYKAEEVRIYDEMLVKIVANARNANLYTNIAELSVTVVFDDEHPEEADLLKDGLGELPVIVKDITPIVKEDAEEIYNADLLDTRARLKESYEENDSLRKDIDKLEGDRDRYKQWFSEASSRNYRLLEQIKAISTLLSALCPK